MIRALIADDEPLARDLLRTMLAEYPDVDVIAEASNGDDALRLTRELSPTAIFLDIQMPGVDGAEVARALGEHAPAIVFVTAYDRYAVEAFQLHAVDYLLKPFDEDRLAETVGRLRAGRSRARAEAQLAGLFARLGERLVRQAPQRLERLFLTDGDRTVPKRLEEIGWVEANGKQLRVYAGGRSYVFPGPLTALESRLDERRFIRVSRAAIVNIDHVLEVQPWFAREYVLILRDGTRVTTTRGYRERLERAMGKRKDG